MIQTEYIEDVIKLMKKYKVNHIEVEGLVITRPIEHKQIRSHTIQPVTVNDIKSIIEDEREPWNNASQSDIDNWANRLKSS